MTSIINDNPMKLLDRFIFSRLNDGLVFGKSIYVQLHVVIIFTIKYSSGVTASGLISLSISEICSAHNLDL